jgi:molybdate transport system regulatory protein
MKAITKIIFLDEKGEKFFGEGPTQLLHQIEKTGSVRAASIDMGMAYTKAVKLIKNAEAALGFPIITRTIGGKDGGGSRLTPQGKEWLIRYERYRDACRDANARLYKEFFPEQQ